MRSITLVLAVLLMSQSAYATDQVAIEAKLIQNGKTVTIFNTGAKLGVTTSIAHGREFGVIETTLSTTGSSSSSSENVDRRALFDGIDLKLMPSMCRDGEQMGHCLQWDVLLSKLARISKERTAISSYELPEFDSFRSIQQVRFRSGQVLQALKARAGKDEYVLELTPTLVADTELTGGAITTDAAGWSYARCPAGTHLLGGGYNATKGALPSTPVPLISRPDLERNAWALHAVVENETLDDRMPHQLFMPYAYCSEVSSPTEPA
ncbi:hypothetical protein [Xanthomonas arboricola]|uniref:Uncharacterized protein n=1 Tax=Xanthomonas arboricola TaxID=56448 RepID=A0AB73H267_9XANT|nr:hypothetical protein [Xanthomonas arboricola]MBB5672494.1 hypothetical protein [Xanthomonas arboricola]